MNGKQQAELFQASRNSGDSHFEFLVWHAPLMKNQASLSGWTASNWILNCILAAFFVAGIFLSANTIDRCKTGYSDFLLDYTAAYAIRLGQPIYGQATADLSAGLTGLRVDNSSHAVTGVRASNFCTPFGVLFFLPLTYLPYKDAFVLWGTINILFYLSGICLAMKICKVPPPWSVAIFCLSCFWPPYLDSLKQGQVSMLIAFGSCLLFWFLQQQKRYLAALAFSLLFMIKLSPGLFGLYFLLKRDWRAIILASAAVVCESALTLTLLGYQPLFVYFTKVLREDAPSWYTYPPNVSLFAAVFPLFKENALVANLIPLTALAYITAGGIFLLIFLFITQRCFRAMQIDDELKALALICVGMALLSPISWPHGFGILLLPLLLLLSRSISNPRKLMILLFVLALLSIPNEPLYIGLWQHFGNSGIPWWIYLSCKGQFWGLVFLLLLSAESAEKNKSSSDNAAAAANPGLT